MSRRVLITGARSLAALDLARDFKRLGYCVHLADSTGGRAAYFSRFVDATHNYPSPTHQFSAFSDVMASLVSNLKIDLVVPTCEEVFHLARLGVDHPVSSKLFAPPLSVLRNLHDKGAFAKLCAAQGIHVPPTHRLTKPDDTLDFASTAYEWVFKPCFSRFGTETLVGPSPEALARLSVTSDRPWIAQRRIVGQEVCFHAIARAGVLTAFVAYSGSWRLATGASLAFAPLSGEIDRQAAVYAETLAAAITMTGQFACDGIVDAEGVLWLIECNPRATSGIHLLAGLGLLASAISDDTYNSLLKTSTAETRHILPAMITLGLAQAVTTGQLGPWWRVFRAGTDVAGIVGDRLPLLGAVIDGLEFMRLGHRHSLSATAATTYDIEWNGET